MTVLFRDFPWGQYCFEVGRQLGLREVRNKDRTVILVTLARLVHGELNGELSEKLEVSMARSHLGTEELVEMIFNSASQLELEHLLEPKLLEVLFGSWVDEFNLGWEVPEDEGECDAST
jgi:hypothetical protein